MAILLYFTIYLITFIIFDKIFWKIRFRVYDFSNLRLIDNGIEFYSKNQHRLNIDDAKWIYDANKITIFTSKNLITICNVKNVFMNKCWLYFTSLGTVTINGAIDVEVKPYSEFVSPALDGYVEVFNYTSLTGKLLSVLKEGNQKIGLGFDLDLDNVVDSVTTDIARVKGSVNIDFDKLLDLSQYQIMDKPEIPEDYKMIGDLKDVGFNLQIDLLGQNNVEYANLDLVFANGEGYLRFNEQDDGNGNLESVMKLYFDTTTMNWITSKVPELIDGLSQDSGTDTMETLSKFLSEDLVDSINNYDFSFILDMLKTLKNDATGFELGIDLSALNIGENAEVVIRIDNDADYFQDYFDLEALITSLNNKGELTPEEEALLNDAIASFQEEMSAINNSGLNMLTVLPLVTSL